MAILNDGKVDTLPLSSKSFPLPFVPRTNFPLSTNRYGVGGAVQNDKVPLVCGGYDYSKKKSFSTCYRYNPKTHSWIVSGSMSVAKHHHASSLHPDFGLIMTGGYTNKRVRTVESTTDGRHFSRALPDLPVDVYVHNQVTVDSNTVMIFGGSLSAKNQYSNLALKLNIAEKKWKRMPNLPTGRYSPGCGVVKESGVPKRVIVAGGLPSSGVTDSVEVLELSTLTWSKGKSHMRVNGALKFSISST